MKTSSRRCDDRRENFPIIKHEKRARLSSRFVVVYIRLLLFFKFSSSYNSTSIIHKQYINSTSTVHNPSANSTQSAHIRPSTSFRSSLPRPLVVVCGNRRHRSSRSDFRCELREALVQELQHGLRQELGQKRHGSWVLFAMELGVDKIRAAMWSAPKLGVAGGAW